MNWKLVLGLSVALNVALALVLQLERRPQRLPAQLGSPSLPASQIARPPGKAWASSLSAGGGSRKKIPPPAASETLEAEDYPSFVKKLRSAGLSTDTIATLVVAEISSRSSQEMKELQFRWNRGELTSEEYQSLLWQMTRDRDALLESLLGKEGYRRHQFERDSQVQQLAMTGKFSAEALNQYFDLSGKYESRRQELYQRLDVQDVDNEEYQRESLEMEKAYRAELEKSMGEKVARQVAAELDGTIQSLRRELKGKPLTDDELGQLAQVLEDYEQEQQRLVMLQQQEGINLDDYQPQEMALEQDKRSKLIALLGPERYAAYEKQNDYAYQQIKLWGKKNELSDEQVEYVYQVMRSWRTQQGDLQSQVSGHSVITEEATDPETLQEYEQVSEPYRVASEELNRSTKDALQAYLGPDRYERLKRLTGQLP